MSAFVTVHWLAQHFCNAVRSHFQSKRLGGSTNKRLETAKSPKETTGAAKESFSTRIGEKKPAAPRSSVRRPRAALSWGIVKIIITY